MWKAREDNPYSSHLFYIKTCIYTQNRFIQNSNIPSMKTKTTYPFAFRTASVLITLALLVYSLSLLQDVLVPLIFSAILAILLLPICQFLERYHFPRTLAIVLSILLAVGIITLLAYIITLQIEGLADVIPLLNTKINYWLIEGQKWIEKTLNIKLSHEFQKHQDELTGLLSNSTKILTGMVSSTTGFLSNLALVPLYIFLFMLYRDFIRVFFYKAFKNVSQLKINSVLTKVKEVILNYMVGLVLVIIIIGVLNTLSLFFLGIDHAVFFGFFAAFLVLIPYIGVAIGSLLPIIMALITKDSAWYAVGVAISFAVVQFLEGNFITPYVVGSKVSINSLAAIIALFLFGNLWGIPGLILALPLTAILKVLFDSVEFLKPYGFLLGDADHIDVSKYS